MDEKMRNLDDLIFWLPRKDAAGNLRVFKSSPSAPAQPDYVGAANATAAGNLQAAEEAQAANMVNQVGPNGNLTYTQTPGTNQWTSTTTLSPAQQALLNQQNSTSLGLGNLESQGVSQVQNAMNNPVTASDLPTLSVNAGQTGQQAMMAMEQPIINQQDQATETQLANQGIAPGSEAYTNAMRVQNSSDNNLITQATLNGINVGNSTQAQALNTDLALQNQPLTMLNGIRSGAAVTNPTFGSTPVQQTTAGANLSGAAQSQGTNALGLYNAQVGQTNAANAGLYSLGSAAANSGLASSAGSAAADGLWSLLGDSIFTL
jgi:hypothetical protein